MAAEKTPQSAPTKQSELAASKVAVGEAYEKLLEARDHFASAANHFESFLPGTRRRIRYRAENGFYSRGTKSQRKHRFCKFSARQILV